MAPAFVRVTEYGGQNNENRQRRRLHNHRVTCEVRDVAWEVRVHKTISNVFGKCYGTCWLVFRALTRAMTSLLTDVTNNHSFRGSQQNASKNESH
jgi:hypothetical protein